ncbi:MAG TPA: sugar phosphate isomerase/epimerase [Candidatus Aphodoplasma excrementigallinarum]|uniref:Sugar phosphate isomerase/epimerase n=1 Tax=Candidatus Aphodoplasma excrementigallinarum TaxID=2840673 RepID=A0A9D1NFU4_9FIRM|nr:sugar phosphate isomerase/epimerase [Candidatus Aphodoplasma excrementigallinarum]
MKLGVLTVPLGSMPLKEAAEYLAGLGVQALELGAGGCPGKAHLDPEKLLGHKDKIDEVKKIMKDNNLEISVLSTHGNAVHPNKEIAKMYHDDFENTVRLANELEVDTVVTFSGCPGDCENSKYPNWVTCPWPDDFLDILNWQWNEVLIPYWQKEVEFVKKYGVTKVAFEMHPGFCVYNPTSLLKIREAVGDTIGANVDPSHLIWQGIDVPSAIRALEGAIYHFHAKDTKIYRPNCDVKGVLDTDHYSTEKTRSWLFRSLGYGNDYGFWKDIISTLRLVGYEGAVSIEHEDSLMSSKEGLEKAITFLKEVMIYETPGEMFWA